MNTDNLLAQYEAVLIGIGAFAVAGFTWYAFYLVFAVVFGLR